MSFILATGEGDSDRIFFNFETFPNKLMEKLFICIKSSAVTFLMPGASLFWGLRWVLWTLQSLVTKTKLILCQIQNKEKDVIGLSIGSIIRKSPCFFQILVLLFYQNVSGFKKKIFSIYFQIEHMMADRLTDAVTNNIKYPPWPLVTKILSSVSNSV